MLIHISFPLFYFFFQAEDGIRDIGVTGAQTCALPICSPAFLLTADIGRRPGTRDMRPAWPATRQPPGRPPRQRAGTRPEENLTSTTPGENRLAAARQIGRASCRERV